VANGYVSVTPMRLDLTAHELIPELQQWKFRSQKFPNLRVYEGEPAMSLRERSNLWYLETAFPGVFRRPWRAFRLWAGGPPVDGPARWSIRTGLARIGAGGMPADPGHHCLYPATDPASCCAATARSCCRQLFAAKSILGLELRRAALVVDSDPCVPAHRPPVLAIAWQIETAALVLGVLAPALMLLAVWRREAWWQRK